MLTNRFTDLQQLNRSSIFAYKHIAKVTCEATDEMACIESFAQHFVEEQQRIRDFARKGSIHQAEIILRVEHIQHVDSLFVGDISATEGHQLVENRQCVAHTSVSLLCNDVEGFFGCLHAFLRSHILQMSHDVGNGDSCKIEHLTATENRRKNLVFLSCSEDKDGI